MILFSLLNFKMQHYMFVISHVEKYANTHRFPWFKGSLWFGRVEGAEGSSRTSRYLTLHQLIKYSRLILCFDI